MAKTPGKYALLFIFVTVTLNMIGFGVIMPVMPQLIMDVTGEDLARAAQWGGYLSLVYALMQFVMMPIIGGLSDRYGRRPVLLVCMAAYAFDFFIMAVAPVISIIVIARVLAGAFPAHPPELPWRLGKSGFRWGSLNFSVSRTQLCGGPFKFASQ